MKTNIFSILKPGILCALAAAFLMLGGCSDENDPNGPETEEFGAQKYVVLPTDISSVLPEGETTLSVVYNNVNVSVRANHYIRNGKSVLDFADSSAPANMCSLQQARKATTTHLRSSIWDAG